MWSQIIRDQGANTNTRENLNKACSRHDNAFHGFDMRSDACPLLIGQAVSYSKFGTYTMGKLFDFLRCPLNNFGRKIVFVEILVHGVGHTDDIKNRFILQFFKKTFKTLALLLIKFV